MRILHTSDWHVGRTFHGHQTLDAIAAVLGAIPGIVRDQRVDVVLVAGDVYDLTNPSADAVAVLRDVLVAILDAGARVVVTSGNHDSAVRLGFAGPFARRAGLHLLTDPAALATPIEIEDEHGPVDFYGIPYLQPELVRYLPWIPNGARTQHDVMASAMRSIRDAVTERASSGRRSVVVAHTFAAGAERESTPSERAITRAPLVAGGIDAVPVSVFDGVDYVALGHIHGRAELAAHVRYSGAVLHYSFAEAGKPRGGWLVDLGRDGVEQIDWVDLPIPRTLTEIRGEFAELLADDRWEPFTEHYVRAVYTDAARQIDPMQRLRARFPYCVEVVSEPSGTSTPSTATYAERVRGKTDAQVMDSFLADVRNGEGPSDAESEILREVLAQHEADGLAR